MSLSAPLLRSQPTLQPAAITSSPILDFLVPALYPRRDCLQRRRIKRHAPSQASVESCFFTALRTASLSCSPPRPLRCHNKQASRCSSARPLSCCRNRPFSTASAAHQQAQRRHDDDGDSHPHSGHHAPDLDQQANHRTKKLPSNFFDTVNAGKPKLSRPARNIKLLESVRSLEEQLARAKHDLNTSLQPNTFDHQTPEEGNSMTLSREDYKGLVDLYYYTHKNRSTPEAPDFSPTPKFIDDYSFKLSEDFAGPDAYAHYYQDEPDYESPLEELDRMLKSKHLREISVMQKFVDLLLDESSSSTALFRVYQRLPSPGVAFLPKGILRVFLQRMSTPFTRSQNTMLHFLSLIDDMQKADLPITRSEWSSAIYLAGRSFGKVSQGDLSRAFQIWRQMERDADVKASNVTFNILFDIAVRAGNYVIADSILQEMHSRGLRLNRLGRVGLMYYHGLRGDGDAVRKTFHDFVDAGEIVDTLVCNCMVASLMNAGEPAAAEQTYLRMRDLQKQLTLNRRADRSDLIYRRYPGPPGTHINRQMASNSLGRILIKASNLHRTMPEHHKSLQDSMPLRPDHTTFRAMIAFHASVTGDLDRITVLMNEMFELFHIPIQPINFQLLFKGFALHGKMNDPDTKWSAKRLDFTWDACRQAVKNAHYGSADDNTATPMLPSAKAAAILPDESIAEVATHGRRKASPWMDLTSNLAAFPWSRRKHIERSHTEVEADVILKAPRFRNPYFGDSHTGFAVENTNPPLRDSTPDDEGGYTLPGPAESIHANDSSAADHILHPQLPSEDQSNEAPTRRDPTKMRLNKGLVIWLLRAYTRCTGSRERVERIWNSVRLVWKPGDDEERAVVMGTLRRCLKECDMYGEYIL